MQVQLEVAVTIHLPMGVRLPSGAQMLSAMRWILQRMSESLVAAVQEKFPLLAPPVQRSIKRIAEERVHIQWSCMLCLSATAMVCTAVIRSLCRKSVLLQMQASPSTRHTCQHREV